MEKIPVNLHNLLIDRLGAPTGPAREIEPWANHDYIQEVAAKNQALSVWHKKNIISGNLSPLLPAPQPRQYRSTSKRRVVIKGNSVYLLFNRREPEKGIPHCPTSQLEPAEHAALFSFLAERLQEPRQRGLAADLNFIIIAGSGNERSLTFNVAVMNRSRHNAFERLITECRTKDSRIISAFLHYDPSRSGYYREASAVTGDAGSKRLFGPAHHRLDVGPLRFHYPASGFCQVNPPILPDFLSAAERMLDFPVEPAGSLLDLYCGFGLFGVALNKKIIWLTGVESYPPSVMAATNNIQHNCPRLNSQIFTARLDGTSVQTLLPPPHPDGERIVLDPPRSGTLPGVVEGLSARGAARILFVCCRLEILPGEVQRWQDNGYHVVEIQPVDMFPGTSEVEMLISLKK